MARKVRIPLTTEDLRVCADALDFDQRHPPRSIPSANEPEQPVIARWSHAFKGQAVCYFIGADAGPVKIGHTRDLPSRLKALQLGSPVRLKVLANTAGGEDREFEYHTKFFAHHLGREWFARAPELIAEIEKLNHLSSDIDA